MPEFNFRLDTVLRLRQSLRDQCRVELAAALGLCQQAERELESILGQLSNARRRHLSRGSQVDVEELITLHRYEAMLRTRQAAAEQAIADATAEADHRRQLLLEAECDLRSLEILREKQLERYRADSIRRDTRELDEIARRQSARNASF